MYALTPYPITPIGNFIGVVLALLPLFSSIRKLSPAVWGYAIWIALYDFMMFVNTIIWHNNVNIVAPVWCDIVSKLLDGADMGTRACALVICVQLYNITSPGRRVEGLGKRNRKTTICVFLMIIGFPCVYMGLFIIIQPIRFNIIEELGCGGAVYSYVGYIIVYAPILVCNVACAFLAQKTLRTFMRHRREINEFMTSSQSQDMTPNKYYRLMTIACLDTLLNFPLTVGVVAMDISQGTTNALNQPYISWNNVHNGLGGYSPGVSLSTIQQTPASVWSEEWQFVFDVKWDEWIYVLQSIIFFCVFGTTPEMRTYFRSAFWFIPKRLGFKKDHHLPEMETISDIAFTSAISRQDEQRDGDRFINDNNGGSIPQHHLIVEITIPPNELDANHKQSTNDTQSGRRCDI